MRDVFTMGARPIANLNSIHFGSPQHKKTKNLLRGVVHGIGGYGNCMGVPTIAGQTSFDSSYNGNILVNAMTLGLVKKDKIFYSKATGLNKPVIYVGSKTGRDGIRDPLWSRGLGDVYKRQHGIGGYGNCMGVPTIAGQTSFDSSYNGNILVNAMTLGLVKKNKIFYSKAAGLNKPVIYVGSKTGRDLSLIHI